MHKIKVSQRAMECVMFGISLVDQIPNVKIRQRTNVVNDGMLIASLQWRWAGYGRNKAVTECYKIRVRRPRGRLPAG